MFGMKVFSEAIRTGKALTVYALNPFQDPADVGDRIDLAYSEEFDTVREAKRFARQNKQHVRFRLNRVVFMDRVDLRDSEST